METKNIHLQEAMAIVWDRDRWKHQVAAHHHCKRETYMKFQGKTQNLQVQFTDWIPKEHNFRHV